MRYCIKNKQIMQICIIRKRATTMKRIIKHPLTPAILFFTLAIICAAGAIYSALAHGVMVANGATFGTIVFATVAMVLWNRADWIETDAESEGTSWEL